MDPRFIAPRLSHPRYGTPRYATLCAVAALAVGLAGCAQTSEPARTAERMVATSKAPEANTGDALAKIARQSLENGDPVSAVAMLKRAHEMSPSSASILAELGRTLTVLQAWREASDAYAKAVDLAPKDPGIRRGHAAALLALDLPTLAESEYRAALALREDAPTLAGLGVTLDLQNRHNEALTAFRRALELDPDGAATRTNLGLSLALWGSSNEAVGLLAPMAASSTADARQRQNLALVFGLSGDVDQARAVSKIDLNEEAVRNNLAYYETLRGLTPVLRMRAILGKETPSVASTGAATVVSSNTGEPTARPVDATPPSATPDNPARAAELAPARIPVKSPKTASAAAPSRIEAESSTANAVIAVEKPRLKAEIAAKAAKPKVETAKTEPAKSEPVKSEAAKSEPVNPAPANSDTASSEPEVGAPIASEIPAVSTNTMNASVDAPVVEPKTEAPTAAAAQETESPANDNTPPVGKTSADAGTGAEPAVTATAPEVSDIPPVVETSKESETPAVATDVTESTPDTAVTSEAGANVPNAAASAEPAAEKKEEPAATASSDAFEGASYGAAVAGAPSTPEGSGPALPEVALPEVSVRIGGVPLTTVPQTQTTNPEPAVAESTEVKDIAVPAADGEASDVPPPVTEPIKRDGPTRLVPQSHAAIDPLY